MKYLFDTNVWIAIHRGNQAIRQRWEQQLPDVVFVCAPVLAELYEGALKSQKTLDNMKFIDRITFQHDCLAFGIQEASRFAQLARTMRAGGQQIKTMDLQIAAIALVHGLRVVTHDIADFGRIPGIDMEDWQV
jgi:tRNA(fMet)-specific endonuclease VapC